MLAPLGGDADVDGAGVDELDLNGDVDNLVARLDAGPDVTDASPVLVTAGIVTSW